MVTQKSLDPQVAARLVTTCHGQIYVSDRSGSEPAVVLMHGFPDDSRIYNHRGATNLMFVEVGRP